MVRTMVWCLALLCAGALAWFVLDDPAPPTGGVFDPSGAESDEGGPEADGPGLKGRDGKPLVVEDVAPEGEAEIHGLVLDEDGLPVAGVQVAAQPRDTTTPGLAERNRRSALALFDPPRRPGKAVARGTSQADGSFVIEGLEQGKRYRIAAQVAPPRYSSSQDSTATLGRRNTARIIVGQGNALQGRVVDADGNGIQAWVSVRRQGSIGNKTYVQASWRPLPFPTNKAGAFTLPAVPSGTLLFTVTVLGRGSRSNLPVDTPTDQVVELPFEDPSGATVEGRVIDTAGRGIAGAKISVRSAPERYGGFVSTTTRATTSDASGAFTIQRLTPGVIQSLVVWAAGYVSPGSIGGGMPLTENKPTRLDVVLAKGATITGRALDPTGQPVAGATIQAGRISTGYGSWNTSLSTATADAEGRFTLIDVPLGPGELKAKADGYYQPPREGQSSPYPWMPPPTGVAYDAKEEGQSLEKDVELARGRVIQGTVKHEDGSLAKGVRVTVNIVQGGWYWGFQGQSKPVFTGEDGTFRYEGLAPDKTYNVTAESDTHMAEPVKVTMPKEVDPEPIEIQLKQGGIVQGRVIEADGTPASGASVTCNAGNRRAVTDAEGRFEITGIKAGKWQVQVGNVNPVPAGAKQSITMAWGETIDDVELTMPVTLTIQGTVTDPDGKLLPGISVRARKISGSGTRRRSRGRSYYATTDTKGHFELKALGEGDYTVWAGSAKESPIRAGDEDVQLVYEEPDRITVEGRVTDPDGRAVVRGSVRVWYGPRGKRRSQVSGTITGGYFRVRVVTDESEVDVEVTQAQDATNRPVNFLPDREKDLAIGAPIEIRLTRGMELKGRITDPTGKGIAGIQVQASPKGRRDYGWNPWGGARNAARSDDEGAWTIRGLKDGDYTLSVTPGGSWITPEKQDVSAGEEGIVFKLVKGFTISGKVLDPDGEPLPGANVWAQETSASKASRGAGKGGYDWMAQMRLRAQTGADGSYELKGLPENALFNVSAGGSGAKQPYITDSIKDVVAGSKDVTLQLALGWLIEGEVVGPDDEPIRSAHISASPVDPKAGLRSASTNLQNGSNRFKLGPLLPGRYRVRVQVYGRTYGNPEQQEVDAGAQGLRFACTQALTVTGRIDADDVSGYNVYFKGKDGSVSSSRVQNDGSFTISKVRAATGTLYANRQGDDRYALLENVEVGTGPHDLRLKMGQSIEGIIDNLPESKRRAQVYAYGHGIWISAQVNAEGAFLITGLPPGKYNVQGWMQGGSIRARQGIPAGAADVVLEFVSSKR
ncbi:MAG: carboxypeptidase regulatory-like domain-containing protein [Planctomycetota bacterium]|nr:carboxypeptidase regulatory-like domain-containing protein [Planctomycetota bacterium]